MEHNINFAGKKKNKEESERSIVNFKRYHEKWLWKNSFYRAYKNKDYATAETIYLSREKYQLGIPDVHAAYRLLKQSDHAHVVAVLSSIIFLILCLVGITEFIS